jgi:addiction module RelE/StbE family toxin
MPYKLFLTQEFERLFAKLDTKTQDRVVEKLKDIQDDPEFFGKPLKHSLKGLRSSRVGKYRIIYMIEGDIVTAITVKHRRKVY